MEVQTVPLILHELAENKHQRTVMALIAGWAATVIAFLVFRRK